MVTSRAVLFGFIGGCFYLIAIVNALPPLFYALMWLTAGILASCFGIALLSLYGLRATWKLESSAVAQAAPNLPPRSAARDEEGASPARATGDEDAANAGVGLSLEIGNAGTFNKSDIVIEVHLRSIEAPDGNAQAVATARAGAIVVRRFLIEALPSRAMLLTMLPLHDLERGRYAVVLVRAVGSDVLGLFRLRRKIPLASIADAQRGAQAQAQAQARGVEEASVIVGPRVVRLGSRPGGARLGSGGAGSGSTPMAGRSDEFGGTRPYVAGDDLRFVHWKSTARRGEMVVREWERTALRRSLVLWDGAAFPTSASPSRALDAEEAPATGRSGVMAGASGSGAMAEAPGLREAVAGVAWRRGVEWSLEVALSLANALAETGEPCTLWRLDAAPRRVEVSGTASLGRAAEMLADAASSRTGGLHHAMRASEARSSGGGRDVGGRVFIVSAVPSASLLAASRRGHGARVVLIDIARLDRERNSRSHQAAWNAWSAALDGCETQLREAGCRVLRLPAPLEPGTAPAHGEDRDEQTRQALRALLNECEESRPRVGAGASPSST